MCAGADQVQVVALHLVDQQPVGLDVAVAEVAPLAAQQVILVTGRWRLSLDQQQNDLPQLR
jgi:hypothetical protein